MKNLTPLAASLMLALALVGCNFVSTPPTSTPSVPTATIIRTATRTATPTATSTLPVPVRSEVPNPVSTGVPTGVPTLPRPVGTQSR